MARIVVVVTDPPLPFGNAAARWFFVLIRGLVARGHQVTALAACHQPAEGEQARALFPATEFDLRLFEPDRRAGLLARLDSLRRPYSYLFSRAMNDALRDELARGVDVLHLEHLWSAWLAPADRARTLVNVHYLSSIDLSEAPAVGAADWLRRRAVFRAERRLLRRLPNISTLTPRLSAIVHEISPRSAVHTVPLGLDLSLYPFEPAPERPGPPLVALIGSFHWQPTLSAGVRLLTRLWPEIRRRVPDARLQIVGRLAKSALGQVAAGPEVDWHENVPEIIPYFRSTDVLLYAPGPATGMKVKVMEAFALGTPVVTNADGVEGLPAVDGEHAGLAEDDAGLIERTVGLLRDPTLRRQRSVAARALLEGSCSPGPVLDRLEQVYATLPRGSM
jgi:glycosyltransferase involved in cell wall biosynthesis